MIRRATPHKQALIVARVIVGAVTIALIATVMACHHRPAAPPAPIAPRPRYENFSFKIAHGNDDYQIEGMLARAAQPGRLPALLVLNGDRGNARDCLGKSAQFTALEIQVACISLPGYGRSSGPSRFIGPQSVAAARRALDLLAARPDVDPSRLAVWGVDDGAVAAGLLMDSDARPRAIILQSGAYDLLKLWPEAPIRTKLSILQQVWPSKRALERRSVVENLPRKLNCSVLILHGQRDRKMPVDQAEQLAKALTARGAHVQTYYFPKGTHELGARAIDGPLRNFLRDRLLAPPSPAP